MMITLLNITFAIFGVAIAVVPLCVARKILMKSEASQGDSGATGNSSSR